MSEMYWLQRWPHYLQQFVLSETKNTNVENSLHLWTLPSQFVKKFIENSRDMVVMIETKKNNHARHSAL